MDRDQKLVLNLRLRPQVLQVRLVSQPEKGRSAHILYEVK